MDEKKLYELALLSLDELPTQELSPEETRRLDILRELLPMDYREGSRETSVVCSLLTGTGEAAEYALDPEETNLLMQAVESSQTESDWTERMQDLGWHCLEALTPIWTEDLLQ